MIRFFLLFVMFLVSSCSNTDFDYSSLHAYFVFDNSQHQDATLQSALNPLSPGIFCRISEGQEGTVTYFYFESNEGITTKQKANADDMRRTRAIGLYNKTGIIVGTAISRRLPVFMSSTRNVPTAMTRPICLTTSLPSRRTV